MRVIFSKRFQDRLRRLTKKDKKSKEKIIKTIELVTKNPGYPSLHIHKLEGYEAYSVSVTSSITIVFHWEKDTVYFSNIGTHDEVY